MDVTLVQVGDGVLKVFWTVLVVDSPSIPQLLSKLAS